MASIFLSRRIVALRMACVAIVSALAVTIASCAREDDLGDRQSMQPEAAAQTNDAAVVSRPLTPDEQEAERMRDLLDSGETTAAIRCARGLMDSEDWRVRMQVVETLAWIGRRAMPEIVEMINDKVPDVSMEAISAWEQAYGEISGERRQADAIAETVSKLKTPSAVSAILMNVAALEDEVSLPMLSEIIDANSTNFVGECARDMYRHITGGEVYLSREVTRKFLEEAKSSSSSILSEEKTNESR